MYIQARGTTSEMMFDCDAVTVNTVKLHGCEMNESNVQNNIINIISVAGTRYVTRPCTVHRLHSLLEGGRGMLCSSAV